ncbi:MAG: flagellar basal body P-ring protein FlgI [Acidobacteria bacterium]|nr:flagellar basal body P-ring protein FlgI [Acidobacteriota bacterium]
MKINRVRHLVLALLLCHAIAPASSVASTRIKDIARIQGVRDNQLLGYGLVVGLNKTGDRRQTFFTAQSLTNMLERMGVTLSPAAMRIENVAAVMCTATLPAFARTGEKIDVTCSSIGDAKSLQGGILLMTPLKGPDGQAYAMAQGALSLAGFGSEAGGQKVAVNHLTVARVPAGATIEREVPHPGLDGRQVLELVLDSADFTTAERMADALNTSLGSPLALAQNSRTVLLKVPEGAHANIVGFISRAENVMLEPDSIARVVVNERTGTVVLGQDIRISAAAVAHGNLSVKIGTQFAVSQPPPLAEGAETVVVPQTILESTEEKARVISLKEGASVDDVVRALNTIGVTPRDIVAIFQALRAAGALQAELDII